MHGVIPAELRHKFSRSFDYSVLVKNKYAIPTGILCCIKRLIRVLRQFLKVDHHLMVPVCHADTYGIGNGIVSVLDY